MNKKVIERKRIFEKTKKMFLLYISDNDEKKSELRRKKEFYATAVL